MEGGFLLDVIISKGTPILQLLASKNQTLLVWWDSFLVLNFCLNIVYGIRTLHLKGDRLSSESLHKYLHTTTETEHQMEGGFLLDVIISKGTPILQLLASKNQTLLVWWDSFLVLNFCLNIVYGI
ncbi:hypothetical protein MtrunA17_Chr4g0046811 [Medicago truncatula]|uniref:Uncharacterized protein n=1 Tax=Medicago truncatula TaxID=3880 RepID=A0A396I9U4_MEDTR|nr:hypothetical protein MtrunA17_Chr4g0046811 [Medicago truncatula]